MIIIRADGGTGIGLGHLSRTSVLARELQEYDDVVYVCSNKYTEGISYLKNIGYQVIGTDNVLDTLLSLSADCIVTDNYAIDNQYISAIRKHFQVVGYIDDNALHQYDADFIVNQNYKADTIPYNVNASCKMLLGSKYLLVRNEFRTIKPIDINHEVKKILLTVGGSDNWNYTDKLLKKLVNYIACEIHVVIGPVFPYQETLINEYKIHENVIFHITPNMSRLAIQCDLAISSSGSTLYELGLLGIPTLSIIVADNQYGLATRMHEDGLIQCLGLIENLSEEKLRNELINLMTNAKRRKEMQEKSQKALNKDGVENIVEEITQLIAKSKVLG